ncbi:intradiol ring-cleavage dioxygenase [Mycena filopes]|nr:intradiol ring-cleavage dioxygenase [Mycena filopes]
MSPTKDGVDTSKLPKVLDMSPDKITANVIAVNDNCPDERTKFIMKNLVTHLHDFVRETSITTEEWMGALMFLTATGKKCTDLRQEFILLSDALGVSTLVDSLNNAKPAGASEATVLGPFHTDDSADFKNGDSIATEGKGDYMYVMGRVTDTSGKPIANCLIDTWETDGHGLYDNQYENRAGPDCRGRLFTNDNGDYFFRAVVPVSYPIPDDGPVGVFFRTLGRHVYRPAHIHMILEADGFEKLTTALYWADDPYITTDAVFGVKNSLVIRTVTENDVAVTKARGFKDAKPHEVLKQDFVLATVAEATEARKISMPALFK